MLRKIKNIEFKKILTKKTLIVLCAIIIVIVLGSLILSNSDNESGKKVSYEDYVIYKGHKGSLEKYDPSMTVDGFKGGEKAYYITGKISTKEDKKFSVITFNLYDKKDKLLGTAVAGLNELKKGEIYEFKALSIIDVKDLEKIDHYELESVELG